MPDTKTTVPVAQRSYWLKTGTVQKPQATGSLFCIGSAKWVANDHILPDDPAGGHPEALGQGIAGGIAVEQDVSQGDAVRKRFRHIPFAAGHSLRHQIGDQGLALPLRV